jgi:hypothetical protein
MAAIRIAPFVAEPLHVVDEVTDLGHTASTASLSLGTLQRVEGIIL